MFEIENGIIVVTNRQPTHRGRVTLTPVNGGAAVTYDMVRADEPLEAGTPINAELFQALQTNAITEAQIREICK